MVSREAIDWMGMSIQLNVIWVGFQLLCFPVGSRSFVNPQTLFVGLPNRTT